MHYDLDLWPFDPTVIKCKKNIHRNNSATFHWNARRVQKVMANGKVLLWMDSTTNGRTLAPSSMSPYPLRGGGEGGLWIERINWWLFNEHKFCWAWTHRMKGKDGKYLKGWVFPPSFFCSISTMFTQVTLLWSLTRFNAFMLKRNPSTLWLI